MICGFTEYLGGSFLGLQFPSSSMAMAAAYAASSSGRDVFSPKEDSLLLQLSREDVFVGKLALRRCNGSGGREDDDDCGGGGGRELCSDEYEVDKSKEG
jgi:hypothetical protein